MERRRGEPSWLLPHRPPSRGYCGSQFSLLPVSFPREVTQVLDAVLLRAASHPDVSSVEVDDLDGGGAIAVSVAHVGERLPFVPVGRPFADLMSMFDGFPASRYEIETNDGDQKLSYKQVLSPAYGQSGNMLLYMMPTIQRTEDTRNWTKVTFKPDFTVFNLINSDVPDIQHTVWKRSVDIAGTMGVTKGSRRLKVRLRGRHLDEWPCYAQYVHSYPLFTLERTTRHFPARRIGVIPTCSNPDHRWEISVSWSHGEFEQISFVNGLLTNNGGTHVQLVKKVLMNYAQELLEKHSRSLTNTKKRRGMCYDTRFDIEDICIFVNLFIYKPIFHSEAKDRLANEFPQGYELRFSGEFLSMFSQYIMRMRPLRLPEGITNFVDAHQAGRAHSSKCYLILTDGESKILSGINYRDRKCYGVLSLESKIPNAKTASSYTVFGNKDVRHIMASLGLEKGACYKNAKKLRYGHVMLMMNQDNDGAHMKGLIITLLHSWWPSLLLHKNFLFQFVIPVIKATHHEEKHEFFSVREYNKWVRTTKDYVKWTTKVYKDSHAIDLVFSNNRINDRKDWIETYEEGDFLDLEKESITYEEFFKKEVILYFIEDMKKQQPSDLGIADLEVLEKHLDTLYKDESTEDINKLHQSKRRRKNLQA